MRKIIVYVATSADGYIARLNGDVEWLNEIPGTSDYGIRDFYRSIDTILWGRKTYDLALAWQKEGVAGAEFDKKMKNYVFSRRPPKKAHPAVEVVKGPVRKFIERLRAQPGKSIWVMGGAGLIGSLLDVGAIDEFDIHVMPVFIGSGIPLIAPKRRDVKLALLESRSYPEGVVRLHYAVERASTR
jgi:dihydrofolate reductase